jgi:hypothetical protein
MIGEKHLPTESSAHHAGDAVDSPALPYATEDTPIGGADYHAAISRGDIAVLALRLLGVFAMIQGSAFLGMLGPVFSSFGSGVGGLGTSLALAAPYGIYLGLGILLVATAGWVGPKLLPNAQRSDDSAGRASARDLQAVAFSVVGITIVGWSMGQFGSALWYLVFRSTRPNDDKTAWDLASPFLVRFAIEAGIGVVLFTGAKGLVNLWHRVREPNPLRDAGPDESPDPAEAALPRGGRDERTD